MAKMDEKFPNLDEYMEEKKRHLVSYAEGARMYQIPYYSFVRLAKEAGANTTLRRTCVINVEVIEKYLAEHPDTADRIGLVRG